MATDKKIKYEMQGKVRNYLGKQKMVKAPLHWQSGPGHPKTELAYITKKEKDLILKKDLHGSLKNGPNVGPSGIMSLNDAGTGRSGTEMSAAETGGTGHGMSANEAAGHRQAAIAAGAQRTAKDDIADYNRSQWNERFKSYKDRTSRDPRSNWGGGLGGLLRGVLGIFGGIPGKMLSGIMTAKNWAKNKAIGIGDEFEEFKSHDNFADYLNRNKNVANNTLGLAVNRQIAPISPGKRVGEDTGSYGTGSQYDNSDLTNYNEHSNMDVNKNLFDPNNVAQLIANREAINTAPSFQDGGRIGYAFGRGPVLDENVDESTIDIMNDQGVPHSEMVGKSPFELRIDELMDEGMSWQEAYTIASEEFGQVVEGESDQGIASIV